MAPVPANGPWYVADLVLAVDVSGDERTVTQIHTLLIRAATAEGAYREAMHLGHEREDDYDNPAGNTVSVKFLGVKDLSLVVDELDHGAELYFTEHLGLTEDQQKGLVRAKASLGAFSPVRSSDRPDYSCGPEFGDAVTLIRRTLPRGDE